MLGRRRFIILASGTLVVPLACSKPVPGSKPRDTANRQPTTGPTKASSETNPAVLVDYSARFADFEPADEPNGDLTKVVWPDFVTKADPEVKALYEYQITHGEIMRWMPCFCGCGSDGGDHRSNRDCYVDRVLADGSVELDSMAPT